MVFRGEQQGAKHDIAHTHTHTHSGHHTLRVSPWLQQQKSLFFFSGVIWLSGRAPAPRGAERSAMDSLVEASHGLCVRLSWEAEKQELVLVNRLTAERVVVGKSQQAFKVQDLGSCR